MAHGVVVFDIDGVLVDSSQRYNHCQSITKSRREFWNCFFDCSLLYMDRPNERLIQLARAFKNLGWRVVVLTGRVETMRDCTEEELYRFGVPFDELMMRLERDYRRAGSIKKDVVCGWVGVFERVIAYDDDPSVIEALRGCGVVVVPVSLFTLPGVQKNLASNQPA
jgi:phosphoglycolate phosphatase-like HAD superfamily hydrolase